MKIQCGNCGHRHGSVDAVRACYGDDVRMVSDANTRKTHYQEHADRGTITREQANRYDRNSGSDRMATDKMVRFVRNLARDREMSPGTAAEAMAKVFGGSMTFDFARQFIDSYKSAPAKVARKQAESGRAAVDHDGMYRDPSSGEIYKVQWNRAQGDGRRLYAKRLVLSGVPRDDVAFGKRHNVTPGTQLMEGTAEVSFVYATGAIHRIRPEWKMTVEEAREFGALYGTCVRCGRTLTLEESIERSMGLTCARKEGWA